MFLDICGCLRQLFSCIGVYYVLSYWTDQKGESGLLFKLSLVNLSDLSPAPTTVSSASSSAEPAEPATAAGSRAESQGLDGDGLEEDDTADEGERRRRDGDGSGDEAEGLGLVDEEGGDEEEDDDGGGQELHAAERTFVILA